MDRLWTPWRMDYVQTAGKNDGCIFCELPTGGDDEGALILARSDAAFIIMNKFPYNSGHLMVAPFRHCARYDELSVDETADVAALTARAVRALQETYQPEGFNIGINMGRAAGAGIEAHLHQHIVPRWAGDTNYMTTIGGTKVLPETLEQTYARLAGLLG